MNIRVLEVIALIAATHAWPAVAAADWRMVVAQTWSIEQPEPAVNVKQLRVQALVGPENYEAPLPGRPIVRAQFGPVSQRLSCEVYFNNDNIWECTGTLDLGDLTQGSVYTLTMSAFGARGERAREEHDLLFDIPPLVKVLQPARWSVARGPIRVVAECVPQEPGGCTMQAWYGTNATSYRPANFFAEGVSRIDTVIDLSAYSPSDGLLSFRTVSQRGQARHHRHELHVDTSAGSLREVERVDGLVVDADAAHLLYLSPDQKTMKVLDRRRRTVSTSPRLPPFENWQDSQESALFNADGWTYRTDPLEAFADSALAPRGSVIALDYGNFVEWVDGRFIPPPVRRGVDAGRLGLSPSGNYLLWVAWDDDPQVLRRDLATGRDTSVPRAALAPNPLVADDGDLAFAHGPELLNPDRFSIARAGRMRELVRDGSGNVSIDNINAAYTRVVDFTAPCRGTLELVLLDRAGVEHVLASGPRWRPTCNPDSPRNSPYIIVHRLYEGYAAFLTQWPGRAGVSVRDPEGTIERVFELEGSLEATIDLVFVLEDSIEAMGSGGQLLVRAGGQRHWAAPGHAPALVSGAFGAAQWTGREFHVAAGNTLFNIRGAPGATAVGGDEPEAAQTPLGE